MATKQQIEATTEQMYEHLDKAYELAGALRDAFTGIPEYEQELKERCNHIRGGLSELNRYKSVFKRMIQFYEKGK